MKYQYLRAYCIEHGYFEQAFIYETIAGTAARAEKTGKLFAHMDVDRVQHWFTNSMYEDHYLGVSAVVIEGQYVFAFQVWCPWYNDQAVLAEQALWRILPGNANPFPAIEQLGRDLGCDSIALGTVFAPDRALTRLYKKAGLDVQSVTLAKEIQWE